MDRMDSCSRARVDNKYFEQRLKTFYNWPKQMIPDKYALAKAGFLYTGEGDKVMCFRCGVGVCDWERTDGAWKEHKKWSPNCDYLKMVGGNEDLPDTPNGFGQVKSSTSSNSNGGFSLPKPQPPVSADIADRPLRQTDSSQLKLGSTPKTDSNLFVYRY